MHEITTVIKYDVYHSNVCGPIFVSSFQTRKSAEEYIVETVTELRQRLSNMKARFEAADFTGWPHLQALPEEERKAKIPEMIKFWCDEEQYPTYYIKYSKVVTTTDSEEDFWEFYPE
jgi:hypothetical protein